MRTHDALQRLDRRAKVQRLAALDAARMASAAYAIGDTETGTWAAHERVRYARSAEWAEHRAQAMALPRGEVVAACGTRFRAVACGCGRSEVPVGCDQPQLCQRCSKRHWRRWRRRITRSLDAHVRAARGEWHRERSGMMPGVYLLTFTAPHSGSIMQDREAMARGWRKISKVASARGWWGAYALTYEVTPGRDGLGHVHIHLAAVSSWIPYEELHEEWRKAVPGALVLDVSPPRSTKRVSAADYLAKYVTKGVDPRVFTGQKAGELLVAFRGKRKVTTSVGFWRPERDRDRTCKGCGCVHRMAQSPGSLRTVIPGAVLQAIAERIGWWIPRGGVQAELRDILRPKGEKHA